MIDFVHPGLLAGALLCAAPLILHLVMRQQPRQLEFPALRFIQAREQVNRRRMRLQHWLLLALRMAAISLLALALARPSLTSSGILGDQEAPVAAALVFDTAPRLDYRQENRTRLEAARELADWLLGQLPAESQVAIVDGREGPAVFQVDLPSARQRIERLETSAAARPLAASLDAAAELLATSPLERREVYVFSDLAAAAWGGESAARLAPRLDDLRDVGLYVVDVGATAPRNLALAELRLSRELLARNSPLTLAADVASEGLAAEATVELNLIDADGRPQKRAQQTAAVEAGQAAAVEFFLGGLDEGTHQGFVRVVAGDPLGADDVRYFTVRVRPAWRVLIAAPAPAAEQALYLAEALAPAAFRASGQARFACETVGYDQLSGQTLDDYAAVALLDPPPLADAAWQDLAEYAERGGGVFVALGPAATPPREFHRPAPLALLPGKLDAQARFPDGDVYLAPDGREHPLLARFQPLRGQVPWDLFPVLRHWQFEELLPGAATIIPYSHDRPALVERTLGRGRVLTLTTPISEPPGLRDDARWNLLATGLEPWPFVMLANEALLYLVGQADERFNFTAGEAALVRLDPTERRPTYLVETPRGDVLRQAADPATDLLRVATTDWAGNYRITAGPATATPAPAPPTAATPAAAPPPAAPPAPAGTAPAAGAASPPAPATSAAASGLVSRGFSANLPAGSTRLARLEPDALRARFAPHDVQLARSQSELVRGVHAHRVGRELYPWLIGLVALALAVEHVLANRFYRPR